MTKIAKLFLLLTVIGPLHMGEQLLTDISEFYMIRGFVAKYHALFDPAAVDSGTVILITVIWTFVSLLFFSLLLGKRARLIVPGLFGVFGVTEAHHVFEALSKGGYDAGVITSVPYAIAGAYLVAAVWRELRTDRVTAAPREEAAALAH
jgi:hypothetical protein